MREKSSSESPSTATAGASRPGRTLFCIHSYAGELGTPCGWRGYRDEVTRGSEPRLLRCPRCGGATLMKLLSHGAEVT